jgi:hypothetical protein
LYTERITLTTSPEIAKKSDIPPVLMDAEGLYATAHRLSLLPLEKKAFHFLTSTCNIRNITARAFGRFAAAHPDVAKYYDAYFLENWKQVKVADEFDQYFDSLENNGDEYKLANKKFRRMIRELG